MAIAFKPWLKVVPLVYYLLLKKKDASSAKRLQFEERPLVKSLMSTRNNKP